MFVIIPLVSDDPCIDELTLSLKYGRRQSILITVTAGMILSCVRPVDAAHSPVVQRLVWVRVMLSM